MANSKQALKRARQSEKHRLDNKWQMTRMNTFIKRVLQAIEKSDMGAAKTAYQQAASAVDKLANKGLIHRNRAARYKSRLNKRIKLAAAA